MHKISCIRDIVKFVDNKTELTKVSKDKKKMPES